MMAAMDPLKVAAKHWSEPQAAAKRRWWQSAAVVRHINRIVCGEPLSGASAGFHSRLAKIGSFARAISIGCGSGEKELRLLELGIVGWFDLFELSTVRIEKGRELAARKGLAERLRFHEADGLDAAGTYDLVYWNNSLHHMLDTERAVQWSRARGGVFAMDDYVGASRFQWPESHLAIAARARELLPPEYLVIDGNRLPVRRERPDPTHLAQIDPTEAADSENIIPALRRVFPSAEVIQTGGIIYHIGLSDVIGNFSESHDLPLLNALLLADEYAARAGEMHYAVAIAKS